MKMVLGPGAEAFLFKALGHWDGQEVGKLPAWWEPLDVSLIRSTFDKLGLMANEQKSILMPAQRTEFIGAVLDLGQAKSIPPGSSLSGPQHQRT